MSHKHVSDALIARLLKQLMTLIKNTDIKPIQSITTFPFEVIPSAFRIMRGANNIGKTVISSGSQDQMKVQYRPASRRLELKGDVLYLIVGGLKSLCGSLAIHMARLGAKHLVVMSQSGAKDETSQGILKNIYNLVCRANLSKGDVPSLDDVRRAFKEASLPVGGIIQGALVSRDKLYTSMNVEEYHENISCKVQGTWNLHDVTSEQQPHLDFFTTLSSISGLVGQKGPANYAAGKVFLDGFAVYRQRAALTPINESLFHETARFSILQQVGPINKSSSSQLITSIVIPQLQDSQLLRDARFSGLRFGERASGTDGDGGGKDGSKEIQMLFLMLKSEGADPQGILTTVIDVVSKQLMRTLRLSEPMEPGKPLSSYGLDSLAAVEFRNWVKMELRAELTTLDITDSASLVTLCEKIVLKIQSDGPS